MQGLLSSKLTSKASIFGVGGSNIKSIQRGTVNLYGYASLAVPVTSVNPANSLLLFKQGNRNHANIYIRETSGVITNATTITFQRQTTYNNNQIVNWELIEFNNVKSRQSGAVTLTDAVLTANVALSAIDISKSIINVSMRGGTTDGGIVVPVPVGAILTSPTNLSLELFNMGGTAFSSIIVEYQVLEFK